MRGFHAGTKYLPKTVTTWLGLRLVLIHYADAPSDCSMQPELIRIWYFDAVVRGRCLDKYSITSLTFTFFILCIVQLDTMFYLVSLILAWASVAWTQFPSEPEGITLLRSQFDNNITISYKEVSRL